jgi:uncharacterized protein YebE (UPF0316 family)
MSIGLNFRSLGFDFGTLVTGLLIFLARIIDVTLGTVRTISIIQGRAETAFLLGFVEVSVWLIVISTVVNQVINKPILGIFYALGFSTGNVIGILLERRITINHIMLRIIAPPSSRSSRKMAEQIKEMGYAFAVFEGEGASGPVTELHVVCKRSDLKDIVPIIKNTEPHAFYTTERAGSVSIKKPLLRAAICRLEIGFQKMCTKVTDGHITTRLRERAKSCSAPIRKILE